MKRACLPRAHAQRGLSLVEVLLALVIGAFLLTAALPMLDQTVDAASLSADQADLERQAAFAVERIALAVRATPPVILAAQPSTTTSGNWFTNVTFQLATTGGATVLQEKRAGDATLHTIADSVSSFAITALPADSGRQLVQVDLSLAKNASSASVSTVVRMGWGQ